MNRYENSACFNVFQKNYDSTEYIKDTDLTLGSVVNIWGRRIVLCDCDEFTKEYYRTKHGISKFLALHFIC